MTPEDQALEARVNAARDFEHTVKNVTFRLRIPKKETVRSIYARLDPEVSNHEKYGAVLARALMGIHGATARDLGLGSDEALPDTPYAATQYVSEHPDVADVLAVELYRRMQERYERIEGDLKN